MMDTATALGRDSRLEESAAKILPPFKLDPDLRFYSPQENIDALDHPTVRRFHGWVLREYEPQLPPGEALALLLPCTKTKPYPFSHEHRRINRAILEAGFRPVETEDPAAWPPSEMRRFLSDDEPWEVTFVGSLRRRNTVLHRLVISEPMGIVPYESIYRWRGRPSPVSAYDDPGLFEHRGTSVSPWRHDHTAVPRPDGRWRWGDGERRAYAEVHNRLSRLIAEELQRLARRYTRIVAWVAPGLTHRSFLLSRDERATERVPASRRTDAGSLPLAGVNDVEPRLVEVHPTRSELDAARRAMARRLGVGPDDPRLRARFARGEGGGTPLTLPELLAVLQRIITQSFPPKEAGAMRLGKEGGDDAG